MNSLYQFILRHIYFTCLIFILDLIFVRQIAVKVYMYFNSHLLEAKGGRQRKSSIYRKCISAVDRYVREYDNRGKKAGLYDKAKSMMKKCGFTGAYAPLIFIILQYMLPVSLLIVGFVRFYPNISIILGLPVITFIVIKFLAGSFQRDINKCFKKSAYRIYKYLHNQIAAGVPVTSAIKTVYLVADDEKLKGPLIDLSARYARTLDIDESLEEFKSYYDLQEVNSLCTALKLGIVTGDSKDLLARQEQVMFKQYFNYIQSETEMCKLKSAIVVSLLSVIIIVMLVVPMFIDLGNAFSKIFSN